MATNRLRLFTAILFLSSCAYGASPSYASEIVEVAPLTNSIIVLHFKDGYVIHHQVGQKRTDEKVVTSPLDITAATQALSYRISSTDDLEYKTPRAPKSIARKSKGTDFAWFADRWVDNHAVNDRADHSEEHWIYLTLQIALIEGRTYAIDTGSLAKNGSKWSFTYDTTRLRSEAIHVNIIGYAPVSPEKYAYVYHWMGDGGGLDLSPYISSRFRIVSLANRRTVFEGKLHYRAPADQIETGQAKDTPHANFQCAEVYECDFSGLKTPGRYVVAVDGIGCSFPFKIDADVYREPFVTIARALYHNRSGIELKKPYTEFERPAPHNPTVTPGFAGKLKYTSSRFIDWKNWDADASDRPAIEAGIKGTINAWGWYQDAGDWDSYYTHVRVAQELLLAYEMNPRAFGDGELNIPESGNGVPDIIDEAAWLPRFCYRLRHELIMKGYGTGGIGLRICGDHFGSDGEGVPSYQDVNRTWIASGEDPLSTFGYAGVAAQLAYALKLARVPDPKGVDWAKEAQESYTWAIKNTRPGDEPKLRANRAYAAAALFRISGVAEYEVQFKADTASVKRDSSLDAEHLYACAVYTLGAKSIRCDPELLTRIQASIFHTAISYTDTADKRALRWGGEFYFPMLVGQQTTPIIMPIAVAYTLCNPSQAQLKTRFLAVLYTTADYFLGTNSLNTTWATGLGPRNPQQVFHMDAWYNGKGRFHPGIVPYGPWLGDGVNGQGPWDHDWANKTAYPAISRWPGAERWFDNRCSPIPSEFTIHQTIAPSAALYGFLCATKN